MLHSSEAREGPTGPCARWTTREILLVFPMRDAHRVVSPDQKLRRIQAKRLDPIHRISAIFADNCNHPANPSYQIKIRSFILLGMAQHSWPSIWCWYTDQTEPISVVQKMGTSKYWNHQFLQISWLSPASTASKVSLPGCPVVWLPPSEAFLISPTWPMVFDRYENCHVIVVQLSCLLVVMHWGFCICLQSCQGQTGCMDQS